MTTDFFTHLSTLHARYIIKRGQNKGHAHTPAYLRSTTDLIVKGPGYMAVRMHSTNILRVYADKPDQLYLDTGGWYDRKTTRERMYDAINVATNGAVRGYIHSDRRNGFANSVLRTTAGIQGAYYDGMILDSKGSVITPRKPIYAYRVNRDKTRAFLQDPDVRAFRAAFKVLAPDDTPSLRAAPEEYMQVRKQWCGRNAALRSSLIRDAIQEPSNWPHLAYEFGSWINLYTAATADMREQVEVQS